ncbi:MAG TPA: YtxH domain-containing protein [Nitrospirales bacterium]|nr:YtxH domain-containing protein [Nitrospirales bacterium]
MAVSRKDVAKAAAFVAGGAIIGAGLGLLFAPQSGAETRRDLTRYAREAQREAARFGREVKEKMSQIARKHDVETIKAA